MSGQHITKPGKHGTLYLYRVTYCDGIEGPDGMCPRPDPACTEMSVRVYAYNEEHALEKVDSPDEGWVALSATRERA